MAETLLHLHDYDLAATLNSGQAFRWQRRARAWEGVIARRWVRLQQLGNTLHARTADTAGDWSWLETYLQLQVDLGAILSTFPADEPLRQAVRACRGLRLLRQDPWECLASFILSSTKQIVQIQQIINLLCTRYGEPVVTPPDHPPAFSFPTATTLARRRESELRACKMGFRAPSLIQAAARVAGGELDLASLVQLPLEAARAELLRCRGVGEKIANCVLLFAYDFPQAFPVDVWVRKALRQLYFPRRRPTEKRLRRLIDTHFGPYAGWAQQYLFHYMRVRSREPFPP